MQRSTQTSPGQLTSESLSARWARRSRADHSSAAQGAGSEEGAPRSSKEEHTALTVFFVGSELHGLDLFDGRNHAGFRQAATHGRHISTAQQHNSDDAPGKGAVKFATKLPL